ncbi:hypothetical protein SteCoe_8414 [Stentor coeruleus]|uniref:Uncharacterized protein n=1 Tax=Stentor coeruleus TaxID=5963 RepID=A0A1R2CKC4_9CILI|nr:hypothetical protein SteCoe_8414 [Stentor coeruleus]
MICSSCRHPAQYSCNCTSKKSYMCSKHLGNHCKLNGKHEINQIGSKKKLFNSEMKVKLLNKIRSLKTQAKLDISKAISHVNDLFTKISGELKRANNYIKGFIKSCDDAIDYIKNLNDEIEEKEFYCPLESLLIMQRPEILDQIYGPKINLYAINNKTIECAISNFPHCIFQYTFNSIVFSSQNELACNNGITETKMHTDFNWVGRLLSVGKALAIYTGGDPASNSAYIINLELKSINSLSSMQQKRKWHAMTWIDGFPAVLGGYDGEEFLNVVEVYKNGNWERYPSLTSIKSSLSAISYYSKVYAIGGRFNVSPIKCLNSIEKYENGKWELLFVKISSNLTGPGLFASGIYIIIFGGYNENNKNVKDCDIFNDKLMKVWKADFELNEPLSFTSMNILTLEGKTYCYGDDENYFCQLVDLQFNF